MLLIVRLPLIWIRLDSAISILMSIYLRISLSLWLTPARPNLNPIYFSVLSSVTILTAFSSVCGSKSVIKSRTLIAYFTIYIYSWDLIAWSFCAVPWCCAVILCFASNWQASINNWIWPNCKSLNSGRVFRHLSTKFLILLFSAILRRSEYSVLIYSALNELMLSICS